MNNTISAVWVYWQAGADGDELRYSMRSVERHFVDLKNIVVCGDKPDWFGGDHIPSPKVTGLQCKRQFGTKRWAKWVDSVTKLGRIIASPLVTDRFLWLYDDTFFMRDLTDKELSVPRATGLLCENPDVSAGRKWREVLRRTTLALRESGRPTRNYSHHGPVIYDKQLLQQTIDQYQPGKFPRAIESLYMNHHCDKPEPLGNWLQYTQKPRPNYRPSVNAAVINVGSFRDSVARYMADRFPCPAIVEQSIQEAVS